MTEPRGKIFWDRELKRWALHIVRPSGFKTESYHESWREAVRLADHVLRPDQQPMAGFVPLSLRQKMLTAGNITTSGMSLTNPKRFLL